MNTKIRPGKERDYEDVGIGCLFPYREKRITDTQFK